MGRRLHSSADDYRFARASAFDSAEPRFCSARFWFAGFPPDAVAPRSIADRTEPGPRAAEPRRYG
jgi:hypothetical protein